MITAPVSFINLNSEPGIAVSKKECTRSGAIGAYLESLKGEVHAFSIREGFIRFQMDRGPFSKLRPSGWHEVDKWTMGACHAWLFETKNGPN